MLQQKLEEASRTAQRRRVQAFIAILGAAVFVGLFLGGVIRLDFSIFGDDPKPNKVVAPAKPPTDSSAIQSGGDDPVLSSPTEVESTNGGAKSLEPTPAPPQRIGPEEAPVPTVNVEELRERFKADLGRFEEEIAPIIDTPEFRDWNAGGFNEIQSNKDGAISAFSSASYEPALRKIEAATNQAEELIAQRNSEFEAALSAAKDSLDTDNFEQGTIEITKALRLKPSSKEAARLKSEIDRLPEVLAAVERAAVARTENNLELELEHLAAVMSLDPDRPGITERHAEIGRQIKEEKFATFIDLGLISVEKRDLKGAQANLKKARSIFPDKSELDLLANRAETLRKELHAEQLISQAVAASQKDDWISAEKLFKEAGKVLPNNKDATDGALLASTINEYRIELTQHLQSPHRLASSNVSEIVSNLIANAGVYSAFSPTLAKQTAALKELQTAYASPVDITVLSDGETKVTVRGVGIVGNIKVKVIQLKPGKYKFEGARPGYQSKIVELEVPPGADSLSVKVVCDERI